MENNLDKLFKSKFGEQEPDFHPAAWDRMEELLEEEGMIPVQKKKKSRAIYLFILLFGIALSFFGYGTMKSYNGTDEGSTVANSEYEVSESENTLIANNKSIAPKVVSKELETNGTTSTSLNSSSIGQQLQSELSNKVTEQIDIELNKNKISKQNLFSTYENSPIRSNSIEFNNSTNEESIDKNLFTGLASDHNPILKDVDNDTKKADSQFVIPAEDKVKKNDLLGHEIEVNENEVNAILQPLALLEIQKGQLSAPDRLINPQIQILKASLFDVGIQSSFRFGGGSGFSVGPYISYNIGKGYSIKFGGQFDSQNFRNGPEMSVIDKVYSFGSQLNERKFSLSNQKSIRVPLTISKKIYGIEMSTGIILNKVISTGGNIANSADVNTSESASIESEMIKPTNFSIQLGASLSLNRYFDLSLGVEYRPKSFVDDQSVSNNQHHYYPSLGLRYKLFKF